MNLPFSRRLSLPYHDVFAGVENTAVRRACGECADVVRPVSAFLHLENVHADRVPTGPNDACPNLPDCLSPSYDGGFWHKPLGIFCVHSRDCVRLALVKRLRKRLVGFGNGLTGCHHRILLNWSHPRCSVTVFWVVILSG